MDRQQEMQVLLAVQSDLSLAAAARRLAVSAPTVSRAIGALERRLGVALLKRSTRGVSLTAAGERFAVDCRRILGEVHEAEAAASGLHLEARGLLTLATPLLFGQQLLMPIILDYLEAYPQVQIIGDFSDRRPNLHEEGLDVAVLVGDLPDSSLFARNVGSIHPIVCASPGYLAQHGQPLDPQALSSHHIIHSSADSRVPEWCFQQQGQSVSVTLRPRLSCTTHQAAIAACCRGAGLTRCMSYQVHRQLQSGQLQAVLGDYQTAAIPVHLVYREGRKAAAKVRSFVDFSVARLRAEPSLNPEL